MEISQEAEGVQINKPQKTVYIIKASALRQKPSECQCNLVLLVPAFKLSSLHTQVLYPIANVGLNNLYVFMHLSNNKKKQMRVSVTNVKWPKLETELLCTVKVYIHFGLW